MKATATAVWLISGDSDETCLPLSAALESTYQKPPPLSGLGVQSEHRTKSESERADGDGVFL